MVVKAALKGDDPTGVPLPPTLLGVVLAYASGWPVQVHGPVILARGEFAVQQIPLWSPELVIYPPLSLCWGRGLPHGLVLGLGVHDGEVPTIILVNIGFTADVSGMVGGAGFMAVAYWAALKGPLYFLQYLGPWLAFMVPIVKLLSPASCQWGTNVCHP